MEPSPAGDGRQFISWIHEADFVAAVHWLIAHDEVAGVVNLASPQPVRNAEEAIEQSKRHRGDRAMLRVWSGGGSRYVIVEASPRR